MLIRITTIIATKQYKQTTHGAQMHGSAWMQARTHTHSWEKKIGMLDVGNNEACKTA